MEKEIQAYSELIVGFTKFGGGKVTRIVKI